MSSQVIDKCLRKDPQLRYPSVTLLHEALLQLDEELKNEQTTLSEKDSLLGVLCSWHSTSRGS